MPQIRVAETSTDVRIERNVTGKVSGAAGPLDGTRIGAPRLSR